MRKLDKAKWFICGFLAAGIMGGLVFAQPLEKNITAFYNGIKIFVDGKQIDPKDENGNSVEPFIYDGTTYLPARAVGEAFGKEVAWNEESKEIYIGDLPKEVTTVEVSTVEQLVNAMASNTHIKLKDGVYNLSSLNIDKLSSSHAFFEDVYDGKQLVLRNIENLVIEGSGYENVLISTDPRYANVISIMDSDNIVIKGIKMGHTSEQGECVGGVLKADSSKNIQIDDCLLYGCGILGIEAYDVENLVFNSTVIEDCSYGIMSLNRCEDCLFKNSEFRSCNGGISVSNSHNIKYVSCNIHDNNADSMLDIVNTSKISFEKSIFEKNKLNAKFETDSTNSVIDFIETTIKL
ncbi:MAG: right-handed parallel beta-helix repeat-containing protein [Clostridia bacterium]|nr:right-handed parallel beta-helix repeat-containing protein [Clostridia bacterium]